MEIPESFEGQGKEHHIHLGHAPALHHREKYPGEIQSVLFDKNSYTVDEAKREFHKLGYTMPPGKKVHVTQHFIRMRVVDPDYSKYNYRTIWFSDDGSIRAIFAYPKEAKTFISQRYRR